MFQKLKGKIVSENKNYSKCAEKLGISGTSFKNKINGTSEFKLSEIKNLSCFLNMTDKEILEFFLR